MKVYFLDPPCSRPACGTMSGFWAPCGTSQNPKPEAPSVVGPYNILGKYVGPFGMLKL